MTGVKRVEGGLGVEWTTKEEIAVRERLEGQKSHR